MKMENEDRKETGRGAQAEVDLPADGPRHTLALRTGVTSDQHTTSADGPSPMITDYDVIATRYRRAKEQPWRSTIESFSLLELVGRLSGQAVVDLACGEG